MNAPAQGLKYGAAELLAGKVLIDEWHVIDRIRHDDGLSGSTRSACYKAKASDGRMAFVKAFDFRHNELESDTDALEKMVREYNYERNVHMFCNGLSRVTRIYDSGKIIVNNEVVHFIVCEWLDKCLREHQPPGEDSITLEQRLLSLRDTAAALAQMHSRGIAHQDVKPSNAVCSVDGFLKLTDLGSSSCESLESPPHDSLLVVGQPSYAPYELLYESPSTTWKRRRFGCDLFLLGNLCFTTIVGGSLTLVAMHAIPKEYIFTEYTGEYREVLPHLIEVHNYLIPPLIEGKIQDPELASEVIHIIQSLCHPDPLQRGHKKNLSSQNNNPLGLERVISHFNKLAIKAKMRKL